MSIPRFGSFRTLGASVPFPRRRENSIGRPILVLGPVTPKSRQKVALSSTRSGADTKKGWGFSTGINTISGSLNDKRYSCL